MKVKKKLFSYVKIKVDPYKVIGQYNIMRRKKNYLSIITQIENIRKKNNKNWMNVLRLAFKHSPKKAAKIMSEIYLEDNKIGKLVKKLSN